MSVNEALFILGVIVGVGALALTLALCKLCHRLSREEEKREIDRIREEYLCRHDEEENDNV